MATLLRHGDVVIEALAGRPADAGAVVEDARGVVLAEGEATGHAHRVRGAAVLHFGPGATRYLEITAAGAVVEHEEHRTLVVPVGWHRVTVKRQYTEDEAGWAPVQD